MTVEEAICHRDELVRHKIRLVAQGEDVPEQLEKDLARAEHELSQHETAHRQRN